MILACSGASASGSVLGVWQPQLLKSFGLNDLQTGLVNSIPYGVASVLMVLWGRHSDRTDERRWHTALALLLIAGAISATFLMTSLAPTVLLLSFVLIGSYAFKGPFWALSASWLSPSTVAVGLAAVNASANLIGGGLMVNVYGMIQQATGSYSLALLPLCLLTTMGALLVLHISRKREETLVVGGV